MNVDSAPSGCFPEFDADGVDRAFAPEGFEARLSDGNHRDAKTGEVCAFLKCGACALPGRFPNFAWSRRARCIPGTRPDNRCVAYFAVPRYGNEED